MKKMTPVIELLDVVWRNANRHSDSGHSWERLNHGMHVALSIAIGSGFKFAEDDIKKVMSEGKKGYRPGYWIGESPEWVYTKAIAEGNYSAAVSYEKWKNREPFIADDVYINDTHSFAHKAGPRKKERLHVGAMFPWAGNPRVRINSFADDGSYLNAGLYDENGHGRKLLKRFKISREDIIVDRASRKDRKLTMEELSSIANTVDGGVEVIYKALGARTKKEFDALPLSKLQEALRKFKPDARCLNKGKRRNRTPEIRWLEKFVNGRYCKEVLRFIKSQDSVAQAWDAAIGGGVSRDQTFAHRLVADLAGRHVEEGAKGDAVEAIVKEVIRIDPERNQ